MHKLMLMFLVALVALLPTLAAAQTGSSSSPSRTTVRAPPQVAGDQVAKCEAK